jgi:glycerophosphoryl diester phosphodiesterase
MASAFSRFIPAFIPLVFELARQFKRDNNHNSNIKKTDKTAEKMGNLEHLMVRLEKKVQLNRDVYNKSFNQLRLWLFLNTALLIAIVVKLFFY